MPVPTEPAPTIQVSAPVSPHAGFVIQSGQNWLIYFCHKYARTGADVDLFPTTGLSVEHGNEGRDLPLDAVGERRSGCRRGIIAVGLFGRGADLRRWATSRLFPCSRRGGAEHYASGLRPECAPVSVLILVALFAIPASGDCADRQSLRPIMALWFGTIRCSGSGLFRYPSELVAIDPRTGSLSPLRRR